MTTDVNTVDVTRFPELRRIAEEVKRSRRATVLVQDDEQLAIVVPAPRPKRRRERSPEDVAAFLSSAGGWAGLVDGDELLRNIRESRDLPGRPPIEL